MDGEQIMRISLFNQLKGMYTTILPDDLDSVIEISFLDSEGKRIRLLDAVGDHDKRMVHAKPGVSILPISIDGDSFAFEYSVSYCELTDDFACKLTTSAGHEFFLICTDTGGQSPVQLVSLPLERTVTIGFSADCDIQTDYPVVSDVHAMIRRSLEGLNIRSINGSEVFVNGKYVQPTKDYVCVYPGGVMDIYGLRLMYMGDFAAVCFTKGEGRISPQLTNYSPRACSMLTDAQHDQNTSDSIFNRTPRIYMKRTTPKFNMDNPPGPQKNEEQPLILTVGSSAMMGMSSIMMATMTVQTALQNNADMITILPSVLMSGGMFVGSLVMPIVNRKYTEKQHEKKEKCRREKYIEYLRSLGDRIEAAGEEQRRLLEETYPTLGSLKEYVYSRDEHLWERLPDHDDFLSLRLGCACIPIDMEINDPGDHFFLDEDDVREAFDRFRKTSRTISNAPYMLSLRDIQVLGIFGDYSVRMRYIRSLIMQICAQHSYRELKIAIICSKSAEKDWEFARWLPHCWDDEMTVRFWGSSVDDVRGLSKVLQNLCFSERKTRKEEETMHTVIIIADKTLSEDCRSLVNAMANLDGYPASVIALADLPGELPKECHSVISLKDNSGILFSDINHMEKEQKVPFVCDQMLSDQEIRDLAVKLRHTHLAEEQSEGALPDSLTFYDMLRVGNVEQLNASVRWKKSDPTKSLAAPLGVTKEGTLLMLDIHQKAHGPHGLVAGTTGSGKSELLITYLLSMATYYDPFEVGFVLIDYKGGGMSETLKALPHVVGVIDNLGGRQGIHRAMVSITNELKRRQRVFKEVGQQLNIKNLDIHTYQRLYRANKVAEPMQHLIIVSDEFAELKQQEPEFMDDLVSAARIGRSLGVHLILATQRPTGVVNDQILSNTRFRICMKVQDRGDSTSMIGKPDAAMLTKTGRFYLQVGMDEVYLLGQNAWSGAEAEEKEVYVQEPDKSIEILDNLGTTVIKAVPAAYAKLRKKGEEPDKQVDVITRYLAAIARNEDRMPKQIWLPMLSAERTLAWLEEKYTVAFDRWRIDPVIGEVDDPVAQTQYPLQMDITQGNVIVMGNNGSGQEELVENVIYSLCMHHSPEDVNIYVLDFSTETTRAFAQMPHVGDVMGMGEREKITNFMLWLEQECAQRRAKISSFGGSLELIRRDGSASIPNILVIIENFAAFTESFDEYEDTIYTLSRDAASFGIYFLVTALNTRAVRSKILQTFPQHFCMEMSDEMEYVNLLGKTEGVTPMKRKGSGIFSREERVLEFQIALISDDPQADKADLLRTLSRETAAKWKGRGASRIRILPDHVLLSDLTENPSAVELRAVPVGIIKSRLDNAVLDLTATPISMLLYRDIPDYPFFDCFARMLCEKPGRRVVVLDAGNVLDAKAQKPYEVANSERDLCSKAENLFQTILERWNASKKAQEAGQEVSFDECVVLISAVRNLCDILKAGEESHPQLSAKFDEFLKRCSRRLGFSVVLIGKPADISVCSIRSWYGNISRSSGLWIGGGITGQQLLTQSVSMREVMPEGPYGYIVRNEKAQMVKLLEFYR